MSTPADDRPDAPADVPAPGRRAAPQTGPGRPRPARATWWVALVVVVLVGALAWSVRAQTVAPGASGPDEEPLTRATVVCPSFGDQVRVATVSDATGDAPRTGDVSVRIVRGADDQGGSGDGVDSGESGESGDSGLGEATGVSVTPLATTSVDAPERPVVVTGRGELAPGLTAARFAEPAAVAECTPPAFDEWFTGVGAGPEHSSTLELVNPDAGRAVVDVTVQGRNGVLDVPALQGLAVPGASVVRVDLATTVPRREDLALRVVTSRGRVYSAVADEVDPVGEPATGADWLLPQTDPATTNLVTGVPPGRGDRFLVLSNPGDDEGRASLQVVTGGSVFAPDGLDDVVVPAQSVVRVPVDDLLASRADGDGGTAPDEDTPVGLEVDSTVPLTAGVRSVVGGDLGLTPATAVLDPADGAASALLPGGRKELVLAGAASSGSATVETWTGDGEALPPEQVDLESGRAGRLDLPDDARTVRIVPDVAVAPAVLVVSDGSALVRPRVVPVTGRVPQLRPALP